jgi:hypothetical protein
MINKVLDGIPNQGRILGNLKKEKKVSTGLGGKSFTLLTSLNAPTSHQIHSLNLLGNTILKGLKIVYGQVIYECITIIDPYRHLHINDNTLLLELLSKGGETKKYNQSQ